MTVHDIAGTADRGPGGAEIAQSNGEIAGRAKVIALSLPTTDANRAVIEEIVEAGHAGNVIVDTCTIGPEAGTLASMTSGIEDAIERARPLI
jgi:3-hydroxyisobutyrate dehydrogenase-like beta-hydroxyacid dehydrogenase